MAGYSGTPLPRKLGIKPGGRLLAIHAPGELADWLHPLPEGVTWLDPNGTDATVVLLFVTQRVALEEAFESASAAMVPDGGLWVAWPKKTAKVPTDLDGNVVRALGLAHGLVDNKVCAISEVWSGLRFVVRVADRPRTSKTVRKGP